MNSTIKSFRKRSSPRHLTRRHPDLRCIRNTNILIIPEEKPSPTLQSTILSLNLDRTPVERPWFYGSLLLSLRAPQWIRRLAALPKYRGSSDRSWQSVIFITLLIPLLATQENTAIASQSSRAIQTSKTPNILTPPPLPLSVKTPQNAASQKVKSTNLPTPLPQDSTAGITGDALEREGRPSTLIINEINTSIRLAARKKGGKRNKLSKKKRGKRGKRGSKRSKGSKQISKSVIKGSVGIISGLPTANSTVLIYAGDYAFPLSRNLNVQIGANFWINDVVGELRATRVAAATPSAGAGYLVKMGRSMWLEANAKATYTIISVTLTELQEDDTYTETKTSLNSLGIGIGAGLHYDIGGLSLGPEIQYPIYFNKVFSEIHGINILLFLEFPF